MATTFTSAILTAAKVIPKNFDPTKKPGRSQLIVRQAHMNFDDIATNTGTALAANDVFQCFNVSAGETVISAGVNILKVATGACDIDLGMTDVDGFVDGVEANDVTETVKAARGVLLPCYIYSNDTVDIITLTASGAGCIADIWALILRPYPMKQQ
jgi:hypothetical protein